MIRYWMGAGLALVCALATAAPADEGGALFRRACATCHSADPGRAPLAGPGLYGVVGRRAAGVPGYAYSAALTQAGVAGLAWTPAALDHFLADPAKAVPGTAMPALVADGGERKALIAYLASLSGQPAASGTAVEAAGETAGSGSWRDDAPGRRHHFTEADLPKPFATSSSGNGPRLAPRPEHALPTVPPGFTVNAFATETGGGRLLVRAPNGDLFLAATSKGEIRVLRSADGKTAVQHVFASGLARPYGMAFYPAGPNPQYLYVATVNAVLRFPYANGELKARGAPQVVVAQLAETSGGHTTRTLQFARDGKTMFVSVGSATNVAETIARTPPAPLAQWEAAHGLGAAWGDETDRALVLAFDPDGRHKRTFATGLRNCVGMAVHPDTGELLCSVNERDALGDNLPFDYLTRVRAGGYYGWPWYYIGGHEDPRLAGARPDLRDKAIMPDVLIQAHSAPLGFAVYRAPAGAAHAFPAAYDGDIFLALHGSWNRAERAGYKVVRIPLKHGVPAGDYEDFMTGMVLGAKEVWGRPAAVAVAADGALLVVDDGSNTIWRIAPAAQSAGK